MHAVARAALAQMARTIGQQQREARDGLALRRGVGEGYIQFALDAPGRFDVAFGAMADMVAVNASGADGGASRSRFHQLRDGLGNHASANLPDP